MAQYLNQHSFVIGGAVLFVAVAAWLLRDGLSRPDLIALAVLGASLLGAWLLVRPTRQGPADTAQVEAALQSGRPALVEFHSQY